jgi:hypothetical protein
MARAGPRLKARDHREFQLMTAEKIAAFHESWQAMYVQALWLQWEAATATLRSIWLPSLHARPFAFMGRRRVARNALAILSKGIAPVHRRAVANARRLRRTKIR